jgi:DNA gyrase/topoisomerase IV subunit A
MKHVALKGEGVQFLLEICTLLAICCVALTPDATHIVGYRNRLREGQPELQEARRKKTGGEKRASIYDEVQKRYLAYALSTIVSRALPDVRDGLKPVHRRILHAMNGMRLGDAARMRKSAAVVGEVIGKYHPHGDQAAYDALVRMAQDFSLRYPLIDGSGNFGSIDGDSPAAMRYTETRLSAFAGLLLREMDQGTTTFLPTYDAMGEEPDVLPSAIPNILLNGSSGIAVGMSCSFPPHNLGEVIEACRAAIRDRDIDTQRLLKYVKGPDFPTGAEILCPPEQMAEIYASGHGSIRVRGTFAEEKIRRSRTNLIITSIPYGVNKSRLIERIAQLIRDKKLTHVHDVRDESTSDIRVVLELKGDVKSESIMAFVYRHTDLQINFPVNMIAITPHGVPERMGLAEIIRHFLDFRFDKTTLRLQHRLDMLEKRIHILEGFGLIFVDLDLAIKIIRSARNRKEAEDGLKEHFGLDDEQTNAILETRLYKLVAMEMAKLLDELAEKKREAERLRKDLGSAERLWNIVDRELVEVAKKFADQRRSRIVLDEEAAAISYDPEEFVQHEDVTVILSQQGWIRRMKAEVDDASSLKFREGDGLFGQVRVNTEKTVALFTNVGKLYILKALDVPASPGFGEPLGSLLNLVDGETVIGLIAPDPVSSHPGAQGEEESAGAADESIPETDYQQVLFENLTDPPVAEAPRPAGPDGELGMVITKAGKGFCFDFETLREPTKRAGRKFVNLRKNDEVIAAKPVEGDLTAIASSAGKLLVFPIDQVSVLSGPAQGVRIIKLAQGAAVVGFETVDPESSLAVKPKRGKQKVISIKRFPRANRATQGKTLWASGIKNMRLHLQDQDDAQ